MSFNQGAPTVPTLINSSAVLVTGNAASANALTVRQFGGGNCLSVSNANGTVGLFVSSTSNVGIGTANPQYSLQVVGTVASTGIAVSQPSALPLTSAAHIGWNRAGSIVNGATSFMNQQGLGSGGWEFINFNNSNQISANCAFLSAVGGLTLGSYSNVTFAPTGGLICPGNVGIGTTNPSSRLHVQGGDIYASSNINGNAGNTTWRLQPQYVGSNPFPCNFRIANGWDPIAGTGQANYAAVGINLNSYQGGSQIEFYTSATNNAVPTERMRIRTDGNVGIGTNNPGTTLDVNGILTTRSDIYTTPAATTLYSNTFSFRFNDSTASATGNPLVKIDSSGRNGGSNQILQMGLDGTTFTKTSYLDTATSGVSAVVPLAFRISGSEKMRVHTDGNVGIGSASPAALLTCAAAYTNGGTHAEETGAKILLGANNQSGPYGVAIQCRLPANSTVNESDMQFSTCDNSGNQLVRVTIKGTSNPVGGNVGIGTASPGYKLDIGYGDIRTQNGGNVGGAGGSVNFGANVGYGPMAQIKGALNTGAGSVNDQGDIAFLTRPLEVNPFTVRTNLTERMRIAANGNVGLGATSPPAKLWVQAPGGITGGFGVFAGPDVSVNIGHSGTGANNGNIQVYAGGSASAVGTTPYTLEIQTAGGALYLGSLSSIVSVSSLAGTGNRAVYSTATGTLTNSASDQRLKSNVNDLTYGLETVNSLRPVSYNWSNVESLGAQVEIGFIAQEVQKLAPEVVGSNANGMLSLDYPKMTAILAKAIQELSAKNTALEQRLAALEAKLAA